MSQRDTPQRALFSARHYDNDAAAVSSDAEADYDHDDALKTSVELAREDNEFLEEEDLLSGGRNKDERAGALGRIFSRGRRDRSDNRDQRRQRRKEIREKKVGEEGELMYEMEEAGEISGSESSTGSSEVDRKRLGAVHADRRSRRSSYLKYAGIYSLIAALFGAFVYGAYRSSATFRRTHTQGLLSNGTSLFAPTTILLSLDGFRADFLYRDLTPTLNSFIQQGISPKYMLPSFPSVTFPNHFTLVTGLYPESHGIVGNTFWDPNMLESFHYTDPARSMQPKWWGGEPLWVTAESQGIRTAIHMWPGSEAHIGHLEPAYVDKYNGSEKLERKVDRILSLLDLPGPDNPKASALRPRPQLIAAYVPDVDADGHRYGPNSTEIRKTIRAADDMLASLLKGLDARNLTDVVNIVVVSDHGMATTDTTRLIQLDDIIDMSLIEHTDGWPLYGLRPKDLDHLDVLYDQLKQESEKIGNFDVYLKDKDMPGRYHFHKNDRIAPLWMVPKTGWAIVTKKDFDVAEALRTGEVYHPRGLHGYDHEHPLMRAIFVARGPAFPHTPGSRVDAFQNIEVYNIVCDSLGVSPKPNNGTLRLPLKPVGLHGDESTPPNETPEDPLPMSSSSVTPSSATVANMPSAFASSHLEPHTSPVPVGTATVMPGSLHSSVDTPLSQVSPATSAPTRPVVDDGKEDEKSEDEVAAWWEWVTNKLEGAKEWAKNVFNHGTNSTA